MATAQPKEVKELTPESRKVIRDMLEEFDDDGNGVIDAFELGRVLRSVGLFPTEDDINFFLKVFDSNGDGQLQIEELVDHWGTVMRHSVTGNDVMQAFIRIDQDRDGYIRLPELLKVLTTLGKEPMSGEEAAALIEELMKFDTNKDGKFSYSEFVHMLMDYEFDLDEACKKTVKRKDTTKKKKKKKKKVEKQGTENIQDTTDQIDDKLAKFVLS